MRDKHLSSGLTVCCLVTILSSPRS